MFTHSHALYMYDFHVIKLVLRAANKLETSGVI